MASFTKSGSFGWAGGGKNGAIVDMWASSRFAGPPAENQAPPGGNPDAGPVTTGANFGNPGAFVITGITTAQDYYIRIQYGGNTYWGACPAGTLQGEGSLGSLYVLTAGGSTIDVPAGSPGLTIDFVAGSENTALAVNNLSGAFSALESPGGFQVYGDKIGAGTAPSGSFVSLDGTTNPPTVLGGGGRIWMSAGTPTLNWVSGTTSANDLWYDTSNGIMYTCISGGLGTGPGVWIIDSNSALINTLFVSGTNAYTLQISDANTVQLATASVASTVTIPTFTGSSSLPVPTLVTFTQGGTGKIVFATTGGSTVTTPVGFSSGTTGTRVQWSTIGLIYLGSQNWVMTGDVA